MKTIAIIQARMSSKRFPGKVVSELCGSPLIVFMANRVSQCATLDGMIVATSVQECDNVLAHILESYNLALFRGPLDDVLSRFVQLQRVVSADVIVRLTGDCPFADPRVIDELVQLRQECDADYASNVSPRTYPTGFDCEIFTREALHAADQSDADPHSREHVTPWMRRQDSGLKWANLALKEDYSDFRLTVDYPEDLEVAHRVVAGTHANATVLEIVDWLRMHPEVSAINSGIGEAK